MQILQTVNDLLGIHSEPKDLTVLQVSLRGVVVFLMCLVQVRIGNKRFLSKMTAFDAVLGIIFASMMARAVNGSAAFLPTLVAGFVLIALHSLIATCSFHFESFGNLVKGHSGVVVQDGQLVEEAMRNMKVSKRDIMEEARLHAEEDQLENIRLATVERNGEISVMTKKDHSVAH